MVHDKKHQFFVFTLNKPTEEDYKVLAKLPMVQWLSYGQEHAPTTGTLHLQGALWTKKPMIISNLRRALMKALSSIWLGTPGPAKGLEYWMSYMSKEDHNPVVYGTPPTAEEVEQDLESVPGKRTDLESFMDDVKAGETNQTVLMDKHPGVFAKYRQFCIDYIVRFAPQEPCPDILLREWQKQLYEDLKQAPHGRQIIFVVDFEGAAGKSTFADYLRHTLPNVHIMEPGKVENMAYEYEVSTKVLILDVPRSSMEHLQYRFLESVKNGRVTSHKYGSITKQFRRPHVVVMCNEDPNMSALSADRYDVRYVSKE